MQLSTSTSVSALFAALILSATNVSFAQSSTAQTLCCDTTAQGKCVAPMPSRPGPSRVHEAGRYAELHKRMDILDTGNCAKAYFLHKTQAWLNLSRDLHHEGDGATGANAAYDEAEKLIKALEEGKTPSMETAMIQHADKVRPDLWDIASARKANPSLLSSAAREVAYCEVYLVRAGHAQANLGARARTEPLIGMAQDMCAAAKDKPACPVVAQAPVASTVVTPVVAAPNAAIPKAYTLGADALFAVNKADLKAAGKTKIDAMLNSLKTASYARIVVTGHTDADGSDAANQALSLRRALAVKAYLAFQGVDGRLIDAQGKGEKQPVADNKTKEGKALNRRVEIEVVGVKS